MPALEHKDTLSALNFNPLVRLPEEVDELEEAETPVSPSPEVTLLKQQLVDSEKRHQEEIEKLKIEKQAVEQQLIDQRNPSQRLKVKDMENKLTVQKTELELKREQAAAAINIKR